jgi:4-carboxymuconolactone decarboxylase
MNLRQVDPRSVIALITIAADHRTIERGGEQMPNGKEMRRGPYADVAPALDEITQGVLFGDIWERPGLSKRDRSLITVAVLVALYRTNELPFHMKRALENGATKDELVEVITHLAFYAGWPPASTAVGIARQVFVDTAKWNKGRE